MRPRYSQSSLLAVICATGLLSPAAIGPARATANDSAIEIIVNVDVTDEVQGTRLLTDFVRQVKLDRAAISIRLISQGPQAPNHFILVETFASQAAYDRFVQSSPVRTFRSSLYPHLGSPWDERIGHDITP